MSDATEEGQPAGRLGEALRRLREQSDMSLEEAEKETGISRVSIRFFELGILTPTAAELERLAAQYSSSLADPPLWAREREFLGRWEAVRSYNKLRRINRPRVEKSSAKETDPQKSTEDAGVWFSARFTKFCNEMGYDDESVARITGSRRERVVAFREGRALPRTDEMARLKIMIAAVSQPWLVDQFVRNWEIARRVLQVADDASTRRDLQSTAVFGYTRDANGVPISNVQITAAGPSGDVAAHVLSGSDGSYRADLPAVGGYLLVFSAPGFKPRSVLLSVGVEGLQYDTIHDRGDRHSVDKKTLSSQPLVFISHGHGNRDKVRSLYRRLTADGVRCWLDEEDLRPGDEWDREIRRALAASRYVLVCLSNTSNNRAGYVQREVVRALELADREKDPVFLIPVRLEECDVPDRLARWQWVDAYEPTQVDRLIRTLKSERALQARPATPVIERAVEAAMTDAAAAGDPAATLNPLGVFISYRRVDESAFAGRLYDWLINEFGEDQVFHDVDTIELGRDFVDVLERSLDLCKVMIVVIGKFWLRVSDEAGRRRLDSDEDYVRLEVATGLERGINVIPILVDGAQLPKADELPESLKKLAHRNGKPMATANFRSDCRDLIESVSKILGI